MYDLIRGKYTPVMVDGRIACLEVTQPCRWQNGTYHWLSEKKHKEIEAANAKKKAKEVKEDETAVSSIAALRLALEEA